MRREKIHRLIPNLVFLALQVALFGILIDDAFITYRYAWNGSIWSYNVGTAPQEGFSSALWCLILMPFGELIPLAAKVLGLLLGQYLIYRLGGLDLITGMVAACTPYLALHSVTGMDTILFLVLVFEYIRSARRPEPSGIMAIAIMLVTCRLEGSVLVFSLMLYDYIRSRDKSHLVVLFPIIWWHTIRLLAFGSLLSLPMLMKVGAGLGVKQLIELWWLGPIVCVAFLRIITWDSKVERLVIAGLALAATCLVTSPVMGYAARFAMPVAVVVFVLAAGWMRASTIRLLPDRKKLLLILFLIVVPMVQADWSRDIMTYYNTTLDNAHTPIAHYLEGRNLTVAVGDIGIIGWIARDATILDTSGLTCREVALNPSDAGWIMSHNPDVIIICSRSMTLLDPLRIQEQAIVLHDGFDVYTLHAVYTARDDYALWLYEL